MKKYLLVLALLAGNVHSESLLEIESRTVTTAMQNQIIRCRLSRNDYGSGSDEFKECVSYSQGKFKELYGAFAPKFKKTTPEAKAALKVLFVKTQAGLQGVIVRGEESRQAYDRRQAELDAAIEEAYSALQLEL